MKRILKDKLYLAWLIALGGFLLSVYIGEIVQVEPCNLCWYQRMALFPLVFLLGMGIYRGDRRVAVYAMPLAWIGAFFALYQTLGIQIPSLGYGPFCSANLDCKEPVFTFFGFLTFPMLSAIGFISISALLFFSCRKESNQKS
ncbi:MAG: hypothetical protein A3E80_02250 [Chlamydiae bacterium RIFCSPHIGHO2_12_FULL_49_9]|nr:MAG: hypothetical protein A3E80_02250 [Chlamydiae bacterium RIFCSPHIGHO2_12_FULL_49_9]